MKELISAIVKAIVDHPEQVMVVEIESEQSIVLELSVAKGDMGKVIDKQGRTVQAIGTILSAASGKARKRYNLVTVD